MDLSKSFGAGAAGADVGGGGGGGAAGGGGGGGIAQSISWGKDRGRR